MLVIVLHSFTDTHRRKAGQAALAGYTNAVQAGYVPRSLGHLGHSATKPGSVRLRKSVSH